MIRIFFYIGLIYVAMACSPSPRSIYVSTLGSDSNTGCAEKPLKTISKAIEKAASFYHPEKSMNVEIIMDSGTYELDSTLVFNKNISITIKSKTENSKVLISGGRKLENWKEEDGLWVAELPQGVYFEQLWANNNLLIRARMPNVNDETSQWNLTNAIFNWPDENKPIQGLSIYLEPLCTKKIENSGDFEAVIFKDWAVYRKQVLAVNHLTGEITLKPPFNRMKKRPNEHNTLTTKNRVNYFSCYFEGSVHFIDEPGEWAINRKEGKVYYKPDKKQDIESFYAVYPVLEQLIAVEGTREEKLSQLKFDGLTFCHTKYVLPDIGHDGKQAAMFYLDGVGFDTEYATSIPEAITLSYAEYCIFENCEFKSLGANGVRFYQGSRFNEVLNCVFENIGGNPLMIGLKVDSPEDTARLVKYNTIRGCDISYAGKHYPEAVGIWVGYASHTLVENNHVHHLPYTGISNGWQWNKLPSTACYNKIIGNHVHDVMMLLGDGAAIYVLGNQSGSEIIGNTMHDVHRSKYNHAGPNSGLYFDEGSMYYLAKDNYVYNIAHYPVKGHRPAGVYIINNRLVSNDSIAPLSIAPPYDNRIFIHDNDTVYWPKPEWLSGYDSIQLGFYMQGNIFE